MHEWIVVCDSEEVPHVSRHLNYKFAKISYDRVRMALWDAGPVHDEEELEAMSLEERLEVKIPKVYIAKVDDSTSQRIL